MIVRGRSLLVYFFLLMNLPAQIDANLEYRRLQGVWKKKDYSQTLILADQFCRQRAEHKYISAARYIAADAAHHLKQWARATALWQELLARHPQYKKAIEARSRLLRSLLNQRALEEVVAQCQKNLNAAPHTGAVPYWRYTMGVSLFRLWRFNNAVSQFAELQKRHPVNEYAQKARSWQQRIEPELELERGLLVKGYKGKYYDYSPFKRLLAQTPELLDKALIQQQKSLGLEGKHGALIRYADNGFVDRGGLRGKTYTICRQGKPCSMLLFYTEYMIADPVGYQQRLCHELHHALFRQRLGQAYLDLPKCVREGLAVWSAGQLDDRASLILSNEVFSGRNPLKILDGLDNPKHGFTDYLEDALACSWLADQRKNGPREYCQRLLAGEPWKVALLKAAGWKGDDFRPVLARYSRQWVEQKLGQAMVDFLAIRNQDWQLKEKDEKQHQQWGKTTGVKSYQAWLKKHPYHCLYPNAEYRMGRLLVAMQEYDLARKAFRQVIASANRRHTLADDACYRLGCAWQKQGKKAEAAQVFKVLRRDYSWSTAARSLSKQK